MRVITNSIINIFNLPFENYNYTIINMDIFYRSVSKFWMHMKEKKVNNLYIFAGYVIWLVYWKVLYTCTFRQSSNQLIMWQHNV